MKHQAIDFKVNEKYHYVCMGAPIQGKCGEMLPNLIGVEMKCLLKRNEHMGSRFIFADKEQNNYHCRRVPFQNTGFFNEKNLIVPGTQDDSAEIVMHIPLEEIEQMFLGLLKDPIDEKHARFCERAIVAIEKIKQDFDIELKS